MTAPEMVFKYNAPDTGDLPFVGVTPIGSATEFVTTKALSEVTPIKIQHSTYAPSNFSQVTLGASRSFSFTVQDSNIFDRMLNAHLRITVRNDNGGGAAGDIGLCPVQYWFDRAELVLNSGTITYYPDQLWWGNRMSVNDSENAKNGQIEGWTPLTATIDTTLLADTASRTYYMEIPLPFVTSGMVMSGVRDQWILRFYTDSSNNVITSGSDVGTVAADLMVTDVQLDVEWGLLDAGQREMEKSIVEDQEIFYRYYDVQRSLHQGVSLTTAITPLQTTIIGNSAMLLILAKDASLANENRFWYTQALGNFSFTAPGGGDIAFPANSPSDLLRYVATKRLPSAVFVLRAGYVVPFSYEPGEAIRHSINEGSIYINKPTLGVSMPTGADIYEIVVYSYTEGILKNSRGGTYVVQQS
jgi:hypothetical protein